MHYRAVCRIINCKNCKKTVLESVSRKRKALIRNNKLVFHMGLVGEQAWKSFLVSLTMYFHWHLSQSSTDKLLNCEKYKKARQKCLKSLKL